MKQRTIQIVAESGSGADVLALSRFRRKSASGRGKGFPIGCLILASALLFAGCGGGGGGDAAAPPAPAVTTLTKQATMTLAQEAPAAAAPPAANAIAGTMTVTFDTATNAISGTMTVTGDFARVNVAHIHDGDVGVAGPIILPLQNNGGGVWAVPAGSTLTAAQALRFEAGGYYVNAHTTLNAPGEIRGQLLSFADNIQTLFTATCAVSGCHVTGGLAPMSLTPDVAIGNLVNQPAVATAGTRVIPGDSANSVLFKRVSGSTSGPQMPSGGAPLAIFDQNLIKNWIDMGAANN